MRLALSRQAVHHAVGDVPPAERGDHALASSRGGHIISRLLVLDCFPLPALPAAASYACPKCGRVAHKDALRLSTISVCAAQRADTGGRSPCIRPSSTSPRLPCRTRFRSWRSSAAASRTPCSSARASSSGSGSRAAGDAGQRTRAKTSLSRWPSARGCLAACSADVSMIDDTVASGQTFYSGRGRSRRGRMGSQLHVGGFVDFNAMRRKVRRVYFVLLPGPRQHQVFRGQRFTPALPHVEPARLRRRRRVRPVRRHQAAAPSCC